jgi:hypothetical protein
MLEIPHAVLWAPKLIALPVMETIYAFSHKQQLQEDSNCSWI